MITGISITRGSVSKLLPLDTVPLPIVREPSDIAGDSITSHPKLSTLSRQLAESAVRAEIRDKTMDRRQLGVEASRIHRELIEHSWRSAETGYVTELPDTTDPELLERARQATEYEGRYQSRNFQAQNPFAGLSREQLNLIVYDEKGPYTLHERNAASSAVSAIENKWNHSLWGPERREHAANNGRTPGFHAEILRHYRSLQPIEQARYPDNYEARQAGLVSEQSGPAPAKAKEFRILTLFEIMAKYKYAFGKANKDQASGFSALMKASTPTAPQGSAGIKTSS